VGHGAAHDDIGFGNGSSHGSTADPRSAGGHDVGHHLGDGGHEPFGSRLPDDPDAGQQAPQAHSEQHHLDAEWWQPTHGHDSRFDHGDHDHQDHHGGAELAHG